MDISICPPLRTPPAVSFYDQTYKLSASRTDAEITMLAVCPLAAEVDTLQWTRSLCKYLKHRTYAWSYPIIYMPMACSFTSLLTRMVLKML